MSQVPDAFEFMLKNAKVQSNVRSDIENARRLKIHSVPLLFIDGRQVARWKHDGRGVPEAILEEALGN